MKHLQLDPEAGGRLESNGKRKRENEDDDVPIEAPESTIEDVVMADG